MINITLQNTKSGIRCRINNLTSLDDETIKKLIEFLSKRDGGYFRYDLAEFGLRKRYTKEYLLKSLKASGIISSVVEPDLIEERLVKIFANMSVMYHKDLHTQQLGFGEYKDKCWCDVEDQYLYDLIENHNDFKAEYAYYELKRRSLVKIDFVPREERILTFGVYQGYRWKDLDIEYLLWLTQNYDEDEKRVSAEQEIARREELNKNMIHNETNYLDEVVTFGKHKGKKWSQLSNEYLEWIIANTKVVEILTIAKEVLKAKSG